MISSWQLLFPWHDIYTTVYTTLIKNLKFCYFNLFVKNVFQLFSIFPFTFNVAIQHYTCILLSIAIDLDLDILGLVRLWIGSTVSCFYKVMRNVKLYETGQFRETWISLNKQCFFAKYETRFEKNSLEFCPKETRVSTLVVGLTLKTT